MVAVETGCKGVGDVGAGIQVPVGIRCRPILGTPQFIRIGGNIGLVEQGNRLAADAGQLGRRDEGSWMQAVFKVAKPVDRAAQFAENGSRVHRASRDILGDIEGHTDRQAALVMKRKAGLVDFHIEPQSPDGGLSGHKP